MAIWRLLRVPLYYWCIYNSLGLLCHYIGYPVTPLFWNPNFWRRKKMLQPPLPPDDDLFDSPRLSDIRIRYVHNGVVKAYYGHKSILCSFSMWFRDEILEDPASPRNVIEVTGDNPADFESFLKLGYGWDYAQPLDLRFADILFPVRMHAIATKYGAPRIQEDASQELETRLESCHLSSAQICEMVVACYGVCEQVNVECDKGGRRVLYDLLLLRTESSSVGRVICEWVLFRRWDVWSRDLEKLARVYPAFGQDMFVTARRWGVMR